MMRIAMNRKGIFYSLSVFLFLVFLIIVFNSRAEINKRDEQSHIERAQIISMDHFVRDFDRYYSERIIETATKPALIALTPSAPFTRQQLVDLMTDGSGGGTSMNQLLSTNENFKQALGTLTFQMDYEVFSYSLESFEQVDYETMKLNFNVNFSFNVFDTNWTRTNKPVNITVLVQGLSHPNHLSSGVIDNSWRSDSNGCYANIIFGTGICNGNIRPIVCGDGFVEGSEECEPPNTATCDEFCQDILSTP